MLIYHSATLKTEHFISILDHIAGTRWEILKLQCLSSDGILTLLYIFIDASHSNNALKSHF